MPECQNCGKYTPDYNQRICEKCGSKIPSIWEEIPKLGKQLFEEIEEKRKREKEDKRNLKRLEIEERKKRLKIK